MKIILKLLAALIGYWLFGVAGAIIFLIIASLVDSVSTGNFKPAFHFVNTFRSQQTFFNTTFEVMGCIAKADGRVSEHEIQMARRIMEHMGLQGEGKLRAIDAFTRGKQPEFNLHAALQALKQHCHYPHLLKMFVDVQVQAAYADGHLSQHKAELLQHIASQLNCPPIDFSAIEAAMRGESRSYSNDSYSSNYRRSSGMSIEEAYRILGITADASEAEIKKAYRKLMSQNHPDKLVAKGLPEDMIKVATEKTQKIQKAYEIINQNRGF